MISKTRSTASCLRAYFINPFLGLYIFLSSFQWDQRRRNRLHVPCRGCRGSQSGLWISASGLFHSRGILTTPRLSSSHPENVEVYGYCLVQRMSWLVVQRVLMATAWEYSAFVLKARRNMEVRRGLRIWHQKMKKMPKRQQQQQFSQFGMLPGLQPSGSSVDALERVHEEYMDFLSYESLLS